MIAATVYLCLFLHRGLPGQETTLSASLFQKLPSQETTKHTIESKTRTVGLQMKENLIQNPIWKVGKISLEENLVRFMDVNEIML